MELVCNTFESFLHFLWDILLIELLLGMHHFETEELQLQQIEDGMQSITDELFLER